MRKKYLIGIMASILLIGIILIFVCVNRPPKKDGSQGATQEQDAGEQDNVDTDIEGEVETEQGETPVLPTDSTDTADDTESPTSNSGESGTDDSGADDSDTGDSEGDGLGNDASGENGSKDDETGQDDPIEMPFVPFD